jgi:hypothetical protein
MTNYQTPTAETYNGLEKAFNWFNKELFGNRLPPVMFTLTRRTGANGYFHAEQFKHRADGDATHEIALNPNTMDRDIASVLATLVHEMTHLEQQEFGKPSKGGHHNQAWAELMLRVGLTPTDTGSEGGKMTGRNVTHMIDPDYKAFGDRFKWIDAGLDRMLRQGCSHLRFTINDALSHFFKQFF